MNNDKIKKLPANLEFSSMGFNNHPVKDPSTIIPKKARWTLTNDKHPDIHWWMKSIKTDYVNKKISIDIYDDAKGDVFNWIQTLLTNPKTHGPLILTQLDGCGGTIYRLQFSEVKIIEHLTDYDYGSSDVSLHTVVLHYQKIERQKSN